MTVQLILSVKGWMDITLLITKEMNKCSLQYFVTGFPGFCKQSVLLKYECRIFISIISLWLVSCVWMKVVEYMNKETDKTSKSRFLPVCQQTANCPNLIYHPIHA